MEPLGVFAGAVGIATAFSACLDLFDTIRLGYEFEQDHQRYAVSINLLQIRFSRWGSAVGIYSDGKPMNYQPTTRELQTVEEACKIIQDLFEKCEKKSRKFEGSTNTAPLDYSKDSISSSLRKAARSIVSKRTNQNDHSKRPDLYKRVSWAVHHKASLEELIDGILNILQNLETSFPAPDALKKMAEQDSIILCQHTRPEYLEDAAANVDALLHQNFQRAHSLNGHRYEDIKVDGNARASNGNFYADTQSSGISTNRDKFHKFAPNHASESFTTHDEKACNGDFFADTKSSSASTPQPRKHTYTRVHATDNSKMHNGDMYGKSVFDFN